MAHDNEEATSDCYCVETHVFWDASSLKSHSRATAHILYYSASLKIQTNSQTVMTVLNKKQWWWRQWRQWQRLHWRAWPQQTPAKNFTSYIILPFTSYSTYLSKFLACASFVQYKIFLYATSSFTFNHKNSILHFVSRQTNNKWQQLHCGIHNNCTWANDDKPAKNTIHTKNNVPPNPQHLWQENRQFQMST